MFFLPALHFCWYSISVGCQMKCLMAIPKGRQTNRLIDTKYGLYKGLYQKLRLFVW